jgi:hypothetical protein
MVPPRLTPAPAVRTAKATDSDIVWQRLWFSLREKSWSSLTLVPVGARESAAHVADKLLSAGTAEQDKPVRVFNGESLALRATRPFIESFGRATAEGELVLVLVDSPLQNPAAIPIARATDGAVLVLPLGETLLSEAREVVKAIGTGLFLGSVLQGHAAD